MDFNVSLLLGNVFPIKLEVNDLPNNIRFELSLNKEQIESLIKKLNQVLTIAYEYGI